MLTLQGEKKMLKLPKNLSSPAPSENRIFRKSYFYSIKEMQHTNVDSCNFRIFETIFFEQYLTD